LNDVKTTFNLLGLKLEFTNENNHEESFKGNFWEHTIELNGNEYTAFKGEIGVSSWGIAMVNFAIMLNDQLKLQNSDEQVYLIYSGNDGMLVFLTPQMFEVVEKNYPDIEFQVQMEPTHIQSNKEAYSRIIDNLLSNAAKYNKKGGFVHIWYNNDTETLNIQDSGKGIKNPKKIFERFYKEQERGIGIGLHIVKKLCDELNIEINLQSELDVGTTFMLTLH